MSDSEDPVERLERLLTVIEKTLQALVTHGQALRELQARVTLLEELEERRRKRSGHG